MTFEEEPDFTDKALRLIGDDGIFEGAHTYSTTLSPIHDRILLLDLYARDESEDFSQAQSKELKKKKS